MIQHGAVVRPSGALEEGLGPQELRAALESPGSRVWLDLEGARPEEIAAVGECFGFHPLAIEDAQNPDTRPTIEEYDDFLFVVTRGVNHNPGAAALDLVPLFVFLTDRSIVTVHGRAMRSIDGARERLRKHPEVLGDGPDRLLHLLLDQIVDHYFPLVEALEDRVEKLETEVFARRPRRGLLERVFSARKEILVMRRSLGPLREVVANLMGGVPHVRPDLRLFFRDVYDHILRILDELETNRDIMSGLLESHLSQVNNRLGEVMKTLTALATIGLPFTIVSGWFGMNFDVLPWTKHWWGALGATGVMITISASLFLFFRGRKWL
jgi:magnesium transporter